MKATMPVGHRIKAIRGKRAMSLRELSVVSGISASTICRLESGERSPSWVHLRKLASALGVNARLLVPPGAP